MNFGLARQLKLEAARQEAIQLHHYHSFLKMKQEQTKMTREEALNKVGTNNVSLLNHLEALGLIKFDNDDEEQLFDAINFARTKFYGSRDDQHEFIKNLSDRGYKIVKKS